MYVETYFNKVAISLRYTIKYTIKEIQMFKMSTNYTLLPNDQHPLHMFH